ncbi:A/G-specific DNA-adenine glycosylase [Stackebrandtia albiflava]|uniref:Adenine DNA glycosylase n=1 Tax=Stackebrandtia albiflava TaxID=406432 RepID=A0A562V1T9_9ACTN|nr:A/G-specific DNA-adenine glycosylase [Stackebrandtia albiflava]
MSEWLAGRLSDWFAVHGRDLPWRREGTTAWGVLVSEVMSQQTPVSRVAPTWTEWMARWPDPAKFAAASQADVLRAWGRLGYPRRALRLHECAAAVVSLHGGRVPDELADLLALPGVGTYTAAAVAVFHYRRRHAVVDTNVRRVVARFAAGHADAGAATTSADLRAAAALLPEGDARAADFSVALMELGALVCTARKPECGRCPIAERCRFKASGAVLPPGPSRRPQRYHGTTRQVRGRIMALLRETTEPVTRVQIEGLWHEPARREEALTGLITDGLVEAVPGDRFRLPH